MPSNQTCLFQTGTLALALCAILNAQVGMRPKLPNPPTYRGPACTNCVRDLSGRISPNPAPVRAFRLSHPCPATGSVRGACPGYVVDISRGKLRWRTFAQAARDRTKQ